MSILFKSCHQVSVANFEKKAKSIHSFCKVQVWNNSVKIYGNTGWQAAKARKGHAEDHLPFLSLKLSGKVLKYFSPLWHFSFFIGHLLRPLEIGLMVARKTKGFFWFIKENHPLFSKFIKKDGINVTKDKHLTMMNDEIYNSFNFRLKDIRCFDLVP